MWLAWLTGGRVTDGGVREQRKKITRSMWIGGERVRKGKLARRGSRLEK